MKTRFFSVWTLVALSGLALAFSALGQRPWLECESTYLGDGWFRYRVGTRPCPIIDVITLTFAGVNTADSRPWLEEKPLPTGWRDSTNNAGAWEVDDQSLGWQVWPYDAVFEVRSSLTNYQQGTLTVLMSLMLFELEARQGEGGGVYSANVVGYCNFPALVPCASTGQDQSPNPLYTNQTFPDMVISALVMDSNAVRGVTFTNYDFEATYLLEASRDCNAWRKVAYLYGTPNVTTWTTNIDLAQWGQFFRVGYVGYSHLPLSGLPALDPLPGSMLMQPPGQPASVTPVPLAASREKGRLKVRIDTVPGRNYRVQVYNAGRVAWSTQCLASQTETVLDLPLENLPPLGLIRADQLP